MSTINPPNNGILVLRPPQVRGATHPVVGGDIGVALVIYDLVLDGLGAHVSVDPPLSGTTDPGDEIELWNEGDSAVLDSKTIVDPNAVTLMRISKGRLHPDRINQLYYTVRRGSSNIGTSTPLLATLYNKIRPGLKDTKPDQDGHSELGMTLSDEIKNGVGPGFVSAQICFTYPYCRANDIITLKCNGELKTFKVSSNEAPNPPDPGSAIPTTVCFIVDRPFLESAIRPSGTFDFSYTVADQLGNTPDTDAIWSASQTVEEDLAGLLLKPLILRELLSDALDPSETFDLSKVGTEFWAIVLTNDPRFEAGHTIVVTLVVKNSGKPDVTMTGTGTVEMDEFGQNKPCPIEFDFDPSIIVEGAHIVGTYQLLTGVTPIGKSKAAIATVIGKAIPDEKPVITRAVDSKGNPIPDNGTTTASAVKLFGTAAKNQNVQVFANNVPKGNASVNAQGDWEREVTQLNMARHVFHTVASYGSGQPSNSYTVNVMALENWSNEAVGRVFLPNIPNTVSSGLIVTNLGGTNQQTQILNGTPQDKWLVVWGRCRFSFGAQNMSKVTVSILSATGITVTFLDTNGNPIGVVVDSPFVEFSAPPGSFINAFIVDLLREGDRGGYVNKITWSDYR